MDFITLAEAAALTGKTLITIRRLAKKPISKEFTKLKEGRLYIDKGYLLSKYPSLSTQESTQEPTQPTHTTPEQTTQKSTHNEPKMSTQPGDLDTQMLIKALKEQYESRIQDLKEALKTSQLENERISTLFNQHQQLEMARVTKLPAKSDNYPEADQVEQAAPEQPGAEVEPQPEQRRKWWKLF